MQPITVFTGTTGLNIVDDPVRIGQQKGGVTDLQVAINMSVDKTGRPESRFGTLSLQTGAYHSLFCDGGDCFVVSGSTLYQVAADGTLSEVRAGLTPARMDYAQVGARTYYTNGFELGIIHKGAHESWEEGVYVGPTTHRHFSGPAAGNHLTEFFGRMIIARDKVMYWSEPYNFGLFDAAGSFVQFHSKILMVKSVDTGLFISTQNNTYFLMGTDPGKWVPKRVAGYPAVEWTCAIDYIYTADLGMDMSGRCAVWASREGAILGLPDGNIKNLNKNKIIYPEASKTGFGGVFGYNFIHGVE